MYIFLLFTRAAPGKKYLLQNVEVSEEILCANNNQTSLIPLRGPTHFAHPPTQPPLQPPIHSPNYTPILLTIITYKPTGIENIEIGQEQRVAL